MEKQEFEKMLQISKLKADYEEGRNLSDMLEISKSEYNYDYMPQEIGFSSLREDTSANSGLSENILKNSKEIKNNCFSVPKII